MTIMINVELDDVLDHLDDLIDEAQDNLSTYEEFDGEMFQLADFRKMQPFDAFLYGIANGKKDQLEEIKAYIESAFEDV